MSATTRMRRHFTEAAREAAAVARQRKREHRTQFPGDYTLVMVVVRAAELPTGFGWQIRWFGQMQPVAQSPDLFKNTVEAGHAGEAALARMKERTAAV